MPTSVYVNPECSKCRTAIALLEEHGIDATEVRYLERPPSVEELRDLMRMLGTDDPRAIVRARESLYADLDLATASPDELLAAVAEHPILLERPIFVSDGRAVVARPPERVLELLEG